MSYYAFLVDSLLIEFLESGEKKGNILRKLLLSACLWCQYQEITTNSLLMFSFRELGKEVSALLCQVLTYLR